MQTLNITLSAALINNAGLEVYDNAPHGFVVTHQDRPNQHRLDLLTGFRASFFVAYSRGENSGDGDDGL